MKKIVTIFLFTVFLSCKNYDDKFCCLGNTDRSRLEILAINPFHLLIESSNEEELADVLDDFTEEGFSIEAERVYFFKKGDEGTEVNMGTHIYLDFMIDSKSYFSLQSHDILYSSDKNQGLEPFEFYLKKLNNKVDTLRIDTEFSDESGKYSVKSFTINGIPQEVATFCGKANDYEGGCRDVLGSIIKSSETN